MPDYRSIPKREGFSDKINALDHLAYRVWQQYKCSADDYGVMPDSVSAIKAGNRCLEEESERAIRRCLNAMLASGLVHRFKHQGQAYLYSRVWQTYQKVRYPSETIHPLPPPDELAHCDEKTLELFAQRLQNVPEKLPQDSGKSGEPLAESSTNVYEVVPKDSRESVISPARGGAPNSNSLSHSESFSEGEPEREGGESPPSAPPPKPRDVPRGEANLLATTVIHEWNDRVRRAASSSLVEARDDPASRPRLLAAVRLRPSIEDWRQILDLAFASEYLMGRVPGRDGTMFQLTLWWLLENAHKVLAGTYANRAKVAPPADAKAAKAREDHEALLRQSNARLATWRNGAAQ